MYKSVYVNMSGKFITIGESDSLESIVTLTEECDDASMRPIVVTDENGNYIKVRTIEGKWMDLVEVEIE